MQETDILQGEEISYFSKMHLHLLETKQPVFTYVIKEDKDTTLNE